MMFNDECIPANIALFEEARVHPKIEGTASDLRRSAHHLGEGTRLAHRSGGLQPVGFGPILSSRIPGHQPDHH